MGIASCEELTDVRKHCLLEAMPAAPMRPFELGQENPAPYGGGQFSMSHGKDEVEWAPGEVEECDIQDHL